MTVTAELYQGNVILEEWNRVESVEDLKGYQDLTVQALLPHLASGKMFAWLLEMNTKYAQSEVIYPRAPWNRTDKFIARFWCPEGTVAEDEIENPTDLEVHGIDLEADWGFRVLPGRYDHLVLLWDKSLLA